MMSLQRLRVLLIFSTMPLVFAENTGGSSCGSPAANLPKILCLHGRTESGTVFQASICSLTNALSSHFQFVFPTGPYTVAGSSTPNAWYPETGTTDPNAAINSVNQLNNLIATQGPFVGLLGFSQGSSFAAYYMVHQPNAFQFLMLFCGYLPQLESFTGLQNAMNSASPFGTKALVWMGALDSVIGNAETNLQAAKLTNPTIVTSASGAHAVPASSDSTFNQVTSFAISNSAPWTGTTTTRTTTTRTGSTTTATIAANAQGQAPNSGTSGTTSSMFRSQNGRVAILATILSTAWRLSMF